MLFSSVEHGSPGSPPSAWGSLTEAPWSLGVFSSISVGFLDQECPMLHSHGLFFLFTIRPAAFSIRPLLILLLVLNQLHCTMVLPQGPTNGAKSQQRRRQPWWQTRKGAKSNPSCQAWGIGPVIPAPGKRVTTSLRSPWDTQQDLVSKIRG